MSVADAHKWQANRNLQFLSELESIKLSSAYNEWKITVLFYSALHEVHQVFANGNYLYKHPQSHDKVLDTLKIEPVLLPIFAKYLTLYNLSRTARYECTTMNGKDLTKAKECCQEIKTYLGTIITS